MLIFFPIMKGNDLLPWLRRCVALETPFSRLSRSSKGTHVCKQSECSLILIRLLAQKCLRKHLEIVNTLITIALSLTQICMFITPPTLSWESSSSQDPPVQRPSYIFFKTLNLFTNPWPQKTCSIWKHPPPAQICLTLGARHQIPNTSHLMVESSVLVGHQRVVRFCWSNNLSNMLTHFGPNVWADCW